MFIKPNKTKAKLKAGQLAFGVISTSDDPQLAELFGIAGFDFYMLDAEHGLIDPIQASNVIRTCEILDITPMIRIGSKDPKLVLQYLDAGMMGIMMPGLVTVEEVKMLVDSMKYAPLGKRGLGFSRASAHMAYTSTAPEYIGFSNEQTMAIIQFEDEKLLEKLPELCAVEGLDACVVGPRDLSLAMGFADGPAHPEVQSVIDAAIGRITEAGAIAGITAGTRTDAEQQVQRGATMILAAAQSLVLAGSKSFLPEG
ncbi:MAG TPA: aldolase/citrate lyase family protein [Anaerolineales bacterium]|nr:aldolase/citrate lyase family protein [Anaerolineales bacterium]